MSMSISLDMIRSRHYEAYPFSNDKWSSDEVQKLSDLLAMPRTDSERAIGIVVGSGGLPYTLGYLGVSRVTVLDRSPEVFQSIKSRIEVVKHRRTTSWEDYYDIVRSTLPESAVPKFNKEFRIATESGLNGDFKAAQEGALTTKINFVPGDIINTLPRLAEDCRTNNQVISFCNMTNVARVLEISGHRSTVAYGNIALAYLLVTMPLAEDVIIVESALDPMQPHVHSAEEYFDTIESSFVKPIQHPPSTNLVC